MKKCKFLGFSSNKDTSLVKNKNYYYKIYTGENEKDLKLAEMERLFPYHIYDDNLCIATFSKSYFNIYFVDLLTERKEKINKINEKSNR